MTHLSETSRTINDARHIEPICCNVNYCFSHFQKFRNRDKTVITSSSATLPKSGYNKKAFWFSSKAATCPFDDYVWRRPHTVPFYCRTSSREAVNTNIHSLWFDPTGNRTCVYCFSSRRSIHEPLIAIQLLGKLAPFSQVYFSGFFLVLNWFYFGGAFFFGKKKKKSTSKSNVQRVLMKFDALAKCKKQSICNHIQLNCRYFCLIKQ